MAKVGLSEREMTETREKERRDMGHGCPKMHTKEMVCYAERGKVGKKRAKGRKGNVLPATDCLASYVESGPCPN